ncbi:MAG: peptidase domain-containing ABC transporter [Bacteroides sp.]|nr:peptidase domain-containing ABC transporter [Bacteroides sp.]
MNDFFVRQKDFKECGIASLAMVCNILGRRVDPEYIGSFCIPSKEGISIKAIRDCASELGLDSKSGKLDCDNLRRVPCPAILFWDNGHFVVLYGFDKKGRFLIADPMSKKLRFTEEELKKHWLIEGTSTGIAIIFETTDRFFCINKEEGKAKNSLMSHLKNYIFPYSRYYLAFLFGLFVAGSIQLLFPFLTQFIVDHAIPEKNIHLIWLILAGELLIVIGNTASDFIRRWILVAMTNKMSLVMKGDFIIKFFNLPVEFYDRKTTGDILQRINDFDRIQSFLVSRLIGAVYCFILISGLMAIMGIYSLPVFSVIVAFIIIYVVWTITFLRKRKEMDLVFFKVNSDANDAMMELVGSAQEIKVQGCQSHQLLKWEKRYAAVMDVQMRNLVIQQRLDGGKIFLAQVRNLIVNVIAAVQVIDGTLTLGEMFAIMFIIGQVSVPIEQLISFILDYQDFKISLERITEVHSSRDEKQLFGKIAPDNISQKDIIYKEVSYIYPNETNREAVSNVSFRIQAGKVNAIVGTSGSGKTTLIRLLLGYYKCSHGEILAGDRPIDTFDIQQWRARIGAVLQNGRVFNDTIVNNIALCEHPDNIDWMRIRMASETAGLTEFVERKVAGWHTMLGKDGEGLSQGQKQRILIARAVYRNPDILIMDEATNSLDTKTERIITDNLTGFCKGRTVIIIAHRLSTVKNADNIIVMDNGKLTELGTHEELVKKKGEYYKLVSAQLDLTGEE